MPENQAPIELQPGLDGKQLTRISKREHQRCITAYYEEDWNQILFLCNRMDEVGRRWHEVPGPGEPPKGFRQHVEGYAESVKDVRRAADEKNVEQTNKALIKMARHLSELAKYQ